MDEIRKLLASTFELEGLLLLAESREEETPETVYRIIREKAESIASLAAQLPIIASTRIQEEVFGQEPVAQTTDTEETGTSVPEAQAEPEEEPVSESHTDEKAQDSIIEDAPEPENEQKEAATAEEPAEKKEFIAPDRTITVDEAFIINKSKDLRSAFSINDTFRFRRELFGNNAAEMVDAINLTEAMNSYSEAEEYFYTDLGWDCESEEVKEFMAIVRNHFL